MYCSICMQIYVGYMGDHTSSMFSTEALHLNLLGRVLEGCSPRESLIYSYTKSFSGLAARLTAKEKKKLAATEITLYYCVEFVAMEGVVSVFPGRTLRPRTTRSWDFLRFSRTVNRNPPLESDVVVGMIDNGIWPESDSFHDEGIGPPPRKWKGACVNLKCNNKINGARFYNSYKDASHEASPRDFDGHGSYTSSTVAGRSVRNASRVAPREEPCTRAARRRTSWPPSTTPLPTGWT
ncbi:unnamed protein product [Musa hybrid cultivar]